MKPENGIILVTGSNGLIGDAVMRRFAGPFEHVIGSVVPCMSTPEAFTGCVASRE